MFLEALKIGKKHTDNLTIRELQGIVERMLITYLYM